MLFQRNKWFRLSFFKIVIGESPSSVRMCKKGWGIAATKLKINKQGSRPVFTCSKLTIEMVEPGVKYVQC